MADKIIKAIDGNVQIYLATGKKIIKEATKLHDFWPSATKAFGRLALMSLVMGSDLKEKQKITLIVNGDGRLGTLMVEANEKGEIRGYVANPYVNTIKHNNRSMAALAIGDEGYFQVIKDYGLKEPYTTKIPLIKGELLDEFNKYYWESEQIPSGLLISVELDKQKIVKQAGIICVKLLPGYTKDDLKKLEDVFHLLNPFSKNLKKMSLYNLLIFAFPNAKILEEKKVVFKCRCNKNKIDKIIQLLKKEDLEKISNKIIQVKCEFCSKKYKIKKEEALKIIKENS